MIVGMAGCAASPTIPPHIPRRVGIASKSSTALARAGFSGIAKLTHNAILTIGNFICFAANNYHSDVSNSFHG
jgi:hypothetical protein